ncbi:MAG: Na(+)/H(+) antiporter subunit B [Sphingobacteriia bacterium]|nr:Na(+)/H(+) antiporter subunit B [Sphingobacteriia bacterium]
MKDVILKVVGNLIISQIALFGFYIFFHGEFSPGGAFQAGCIFAVCFILYSFLNGLNALLKIFPLRLIELVSALGVLIYSGIGIICILLGGHLLDYNKLYPSNTHIAQSIGILGIEIGVTLTVCSVIVYIFVLLVKNK